MAWNVIIIIQKSEVAHGSKCQDYMEYSNKKRWACKWDAEEEVQRWSGDMNASISAICPEWKCKKKNEEYSAYICLWRCYHVKSICNENVKILYLPTTKEKKKRQPPEFHSNGRMTGFVEIVQWKLFCQRKVPKKSSSSHVNANENCLRNHKDIKI